MILLRSFAIISNDLLLASAWVIHTPTSLMTSVRSSASRTVLSANQNHHHSSCTSFDAHNHVHLSMGIIPPLCLDLDARVMSATNVGQDKHYEDDVNVDFFMEQEVLPKNNTDVVQHANKIMNVLLQNEHAGLPAPFGENGFQDECKIKIGGLALMSTQPRDFPVVKELSDTIQQLSQKYDDEYERCVVVKNYGVHPWFLRQANEEFDALYSYSREEATTIAIADANNHHIAKSIPTWLPYLKLQLQCDPSAQVGEIGLDGARYQINPETKEKELVSTIECQIEAFEAQLHLAADMKRSVSVHSVQCWGHFFDSLRRVKEIRSKRRKRRKDERKKLKRELEICEHNQANANENANADLLQMQHRYKELEEDVLILPPKIYFHAFGGKAAIVDQLEAICREKKSKSSNIHIRQPIAIETFYGFAPIVNFRSHKTADVIRKVGIERLVLETDLEDYTRLNDDLKSSVEYIAEALNLTKQEVSRITSENTRRLYQL